MTRLISPVIAPEDLLPQLELIQMKRGPRAVQLLSHPEPKQHDTDQVLRVVTNGAGPRLLPYLGDPMKAILGKFADDPLWDDFLEAMQENRERESQGYAD
jgi:hypothetical protein